MKLPATIAAVLLIATAACRVAPSIPRQYLATNITTLIKLVGTPLSVRDDAVFGGSERPPKRPKPNPPNSPTPVEPGQPAASPESEWDKYVCRGEKLTLACELDDQEAEEFMLPIKTTFKGSLEEERKLWGYIESEDPDCDIEGNYYDITRAYDELGIYDDRTICYRVDHHQSGVENPTYQVGDKVFRFTGAYGTFAINLSQGALIFIDVASASHRAAELWGVKDPPEDQLPELRQMSDLSWGFWYQAHHGSALGYITKFIVPQIVNDITLRLIDEALKTYDVPDGEMRITAVPEWPGITFDIETEACKALLGSPNGIAAAYFLAQHKDELGGNKYIEKVTVFRPDENTDNDEPTLVYHVKDMPLNSPYDTGSDDDESPNDPGDPTPAVGHEDDETFWNRHVCRGEKLHQASIRNKDTAINFVRIVDSEFDGTMENDMKTWGYTDHKGESIYCELEDIAPDLNSLGINTAFRSGSSNGDNECFYIDHRSSLGRATYKVGGTTYHKTGAYAHIGVNARSGVVSFLNIKSAEKAAKDSWNVGRPEASELPRLRQISDLTWAFWNRAHKDRVGIQDIKLFLVHLIINTDTLRLMKMAMKSYDLPEDEYSQVFVPRWPGIEFSIDTPEGQAMLGSPNGLSAGYFLIQHKDQLGGNKYIHKITIWSDYAGDDHMLLWAQDAPSPPQEGGLGMSNDSLPDKGFVGAFGDAGKVVKRSIDGKNLIREHRVLAKL